MHFKLDINALASCAPAMSKEDIRYYLNGVHVFERDGQVVYEATNGHILIRCVSGIEQVEVNPDDPENPTPLDVEGLDIIIPGFMVNQLAKKPFLKGFGNVQFSVVDAFVDATRINLEMPDGVVNIKVVDATYPDADKVIPQDLSCKNLEFDQIGFNMAYFDLVAKSVKRYTGKTGAKLAFSQTDKAGPVRIDSNTSENWFAILMPMVVVDPKPEHIEAAQEGQAAA